MGCYFSRAVGDSTNKAAKLTDETGRVVPELPSLDTILKSQGLVIKNPRILFFAEDYFENTIAAAALLDALKLRLSKARAGHQLILEAVRCYDRGEEECCLKKMNEFTETVNALMWAPEFDAVCERHRSMYREVGLAMGKIEEKLSSTEWWRKVCGATYSVAFVLALSAAVGLPVAVLMTLCAFAVVNTWAESIWSCRSRALTGNRSVVATMWKGRFGVHEMESVRAIAKRFEIRIGSVLTAAEFAVRNEGNAAIGFAVAEMKRKMGSVEESMEGLEMKLDSCLDEMERAVTEFMTVITVREI